MLVKNLAHLPISNIVDCILLCFGGDYFVKFPSDLDYWTERFRKDRVDLSLSFGMFEENELVGFILTGIDVHRGLLTAYNTRTGVIPSFRNQRLVDQIYAHALPKFKQRGIVTCTLEVIQRNANAVRVYERIGFTPTRVLKCFKGVLPLLDNHLQHVSTTLVQHSEVQEYYSDAQYYAWGSSRQALVNSTSGAFHTYLVFVSEGGQAVNIGQFVIEPISFSLAQLEISATLSEDKDEEMIIVLWGHLFQGIAAVCEGNPICLWNVDVNRIALLKYLQSTGLENMFDQDEMNMTI